MKTWFEKHEDERVEFANYACKILVEKHNGDIEKAVKEVKCLYDHFENNVRNVYQFIRENIPLFSLWEYDNIQDDYIDYLEDREYDLKTARGVIIAACKEFYLSS